MARLATAMLVNALIRRAHSAGGNATVLAKGEATSGAVLLLLLERGANPRFVERGLGPDGSPALIKAGPDALGDETAATGYWERRRARDSDLWVVELDIADAERFAAETMTAN